MATVELGNGVDLSYCEEGELGNPTVVLLPGPTDSWRSYEAVLASVPRTIRTVAVSLRGHGDSSKPTSGYRIEDLASDVVSFLDALDIESTVLAGHSGSCLVARRVALDQPDRIAGLFLEAAPTTLRDDPALRRFVDDVVGGLTDPIDRAFAHSFVADTSSDVIEPRLIDRLVDEVVKVPTVAWSEMFASLLDYDDMPELTQLTTPVMLLWGDGDPLVPSRMQHELMRQLAQAKLCVYADTGHTPRWERPERFAADLASFVSATS